MNVIIDRGNTSTRLYLYRGNNLENSISTPDDQHHIRETIDSFLTVEEKCNILVSDVAENTLDWERIIPQQHHIIMMSHLLTLPVSLNYKTPETLGHDRIANAAGAWALNPGCSSLVVDAGTCIKYDLVDTDGSYQGGAISPGLLMRFKALNKFTGHLPVISPSNEKVELTGNSTNDSILSGVQNGIGFEINEFISRYKEKHHGIKVYLTGGDHKYFASILKSPIFVAPELTSRGLNEILKLNL
jgi:type III pantothenate kinase